MEWWLTAGEGATCTVHTKPLLGGPSLGASRHYSSHARVMLEPLDVTSEQSCILFLSVCECRRRELSLSDLFSSSFTCKIPELRLIWTNVRGWEASFGRFLLPNVSLFFYGWRWSITVIIKALCAFELWLLSLSQEGQWRWQWRVTASVLGRADPCWPLGLNVPLYPSARELGSFAFFLVPCKGPETCGSQARHSWELLWMLCCGCPGWWRHLEILSPL